MPDWLDDVGERAAQFADLRPAGLATRSSYHLFSEVRHQWERGIGPIEQPPWSITFRSLSD